MVSLCFVLPTNYLDLSILLSPSRFLVFAWLLISFCFFIASTQISSIHSSFLFYVFRSCTPSWILLFIALLLFCHLPFIAFLWICFVSLPLRLSYFISFRNSFFWLLPSFASSSQLYSGSPFSVGRIYFSSPSNSGVHSLSLSLASCCLALRVYFGLHCSLHSVMSLVLALSFSSSGCLVILLPYLFRFLFLSFPFLPSLSLSFYPTSSLSCSMFQASLNLCQSCIFAIVSLDLWLALFSLDLWLSLSLSLSLSHLSLFLCIFTYFCSSSPLLLSIAVHWFGVCVCVFLPCLASAISCEYWFVSCSPYLSALVLTHDPAFFPFLPRLNASPTCPPFRLCGLKSFDTSTTLGTERGSLIQSCDDSGKSNSELRLMVMEQCNCNEPATLRV